MTAPRSDWSTVDETFFRLVHGLFPAAFLAGASALLGSHDDEALPIAAPAPRVVAPRLPAQQLPVG